MNKLQDIHSPAELKQVPADEIPALCGEIREFLIDSVSKTGGHFASNLGAVELAVALDRVYDPERDRIIYDVGHQAYVHKLLTGRRDRFPTLRKFGGLSGFPKPVESPCDAFITGHASTSVSAALGMARARTIQGDDYDVCAVIGDGSMTGGLAYEAIADAGQSGEPIVVILNDNAMSISQSVGPDFVSNAHQARVFQIQASIPENHRPHWAIVPGNPQGQGMGEIPSAAGQYF